MDDLHRELGAAIGARCRLVDAATLDFDHFSPLAHVALEEALTHLRYEARHSDDHAADGDQLIDVLRVQRPHVLGALGVEWLHLIQQRGRLKVEGGIFINFKCEFEVET